MQIVTKAEFARICGKTRSLVSQWIDRGLIDGDALVGTGSAQKVVVEIAQAQLLERRDAGQSLGNGSATRLSDLGQSRSGDQTGASEYNLQKARLAKEQADHAAMKNAVLRGTLISADEAEQRWSEEIMKLRARMLAIPSTLPQLLFHLSKHDLAVIDQAIRTAMTEVAHGAA